jgi:hypothetical protein
MTTIKESQGGRSALEKWLTFRKTEVISVSIALLYALVVAGYPFISNIPTLLDIQSRLYGITLRAVILLFSIFILFFVGIKRKRLHSGILSPFLAVFWALYVARLVADTLVMPVYLSRPSLEYFAYSFGSCLIPMLALMVPVSTETTRRALTLTYGLLLAAIILVLVNTLVLNLDQTYWPVTGRLGTEALNPISLGHVATTLVVLSSYTLTINHSLSTRIVIANFISILIGLVTLVLAASRGPLLAFVVTELVLVLSVFMRREKTRLNILAALLIITLTVLASVHYLLILDSEIKAHFNYRGEDTVSMRLELISLAWRRFTEAPLFGSALEIMEYGGYPHNVVIESFMATGIVGGTALTILLLLSFLYALRLVKCYDSYSWIGLLFIQYMIGSLVSGSLYSSSTMWALMGAVIGVSGIPRRFRRYSGLRAEQGLCPCKSFLRN